MIEVGPSLIVSRAGDKHASLRLNLDINGTEGYEADAVFVSVDRQPPTSYLKFDACGWVYKGKNQIGKIQHGTYLDGRSDEKLAYHCFLSEKTFSTGVDNRRHEAYFEAEIIILKHLLDNGFIQLTDLEPKIPMA